MDFRLLGPLEVRSGHARLQMAAGKQRALLAILLLNANRTVAREQIIDALWAEDVPDSAQKMVQIHVSQLRKALPEPRLHTRAPGYLLQVGKDELDLTRFERAVADARQALAEGDAPKARELLGDALALWRGPALAEISEPFARHEGARLEELRIAALEQRIEADLALGHHRDVVGELEALIAEHPLRERLRLQHMLALYRSGRHAEALASYQAFRRTLADEMGIQPSISLRELERQMLQQDPSLEPPTHAEGRARRPAEPRAGLPPAMSPMREAAISGSHTRSSATGRSTSSSSTAWSAPFSPAGRYPKLAAFYRRLASMGRLILFDKRGTGLSDRVSTERLPDLETRMDDVRAVLDSAGTERAALLGISEGGAMSALFAATHPQRTSGLILMGTFPREMRAADYPSGTSEEGLGRRLALLDEDDWAAATTTAWLGNVAPDVLRDPASLQWYTSYVRRGASPGANKAIRLMNAEIDIRDLLPTINVPTLVLHRAHESLRDGSRFMGEHIPGARMVELPGNDHLPWEGDPEPLLDEIERFLSGLRNDREPDRVLATLLFTDIVTGANAGDDASSELLARYDRVVRAQVERFRGREVGTGGEGLVAIFDGPARAVRCASAIVASARDLGLELRAGIHTGEVEQTNTGIRGIAVDIGARIAAAALPGEVLVSSTVKDIVAGSRIVFEERGEHELARVPGTWRLFAASA